MGQPLVDSTLVNLASGRDGKHFIAVSVPTG